MFAGIPARNPNRGLRIRSGARGTTPKHAALRHFPGDGNPSSHPRPVRRTHHSTGRQIDPLHERQRRPGWGAPNIPPIPNTAARLTRDCAGLCNNRVTTLGNIKSAIIGTYRKPDHAERHSAGFAWRCNRRRRRTMMLRFLHSGARTHPIPYHALIAGG